MGTLTLFLQREFPRHCPPGWVCHPEVPLIPSQHANLLGYNPRADLLVERDDGTRRLWIEFEVSRADPVANHAKFATSHLFYPWREADSFVAMVSHHVARGRRNLAANTVSLMRSLGIDAFQTTLLPHLAGLEIKRLNHMELQAIQQEDIDIRSEVERVFTVSNPIFSNSKHRIYFVSDILGVILNLRQWNNDLSKPEGRKKWGRRTVTYFVYDPYSKNFAPSKICAYLVIQPEMKGGTIATQMTVDFYVTLDESETRFDGNIARNHLELHLALETLRSEDAPHIAQS